MSKTSKPLTYSVHPSLMDTDEIKELMRKGNTILPYAGMEAVDVVLGPNCFRISIETIKLLSLAEQAARASKYGKTNRGHE